MLDRERNARQKETVDDCGDTSEKKDKKYEEDFHAEQPKRVPTPRTPPRRRVVALCTPPPSGGLSHTELKRAATQARAKSLKRSMFYTRAKSTSKSADIRRRISFVSPKRSALSEFAMTLTPTTAVAPVVEKQLSPAQRKAQMRSQLKGSAAPVGMRIIVTDDRTKDMKRRAVVFGNQALAVESVHTNLRSIQEKTVDTVIELLGCDRASLFVVDKRSNELMFYIGSACMRLPIGMGIAGTCAETGLTINIADAYEDLRFDRSFDHKSGYRTKSLLVVPVMTAGDRIIGVVQMINKKNNAVFTDGDVHVVEACVSCLRDALELQFESLVKSESKRVSGLGERSNPNTLREASERQAQFHASEEAQKVQYRGARSVLPQISAGGAAGGDHDHARTEARARAKILSEKIRGANRRVGAKTMDDDAEDAENEMLVAARKLGKLPDLKPFWEEICDDFTGKVQSWANAFTGQIVYNRKECEVPNEGSM
jgi:putative methionine-R-sulfoxide reductase with GAF domain